MTPDIAYVDQLQWNIQDTVSSEALQEYNLFKYKSFRADDRRPPFRSLFMTCKRALQTVANYQNVH